MVTRLARKVYRFLVMKTTNRKALASAYAKLGTLNAEWHTCLTSERSAQVYAERKALWVEIDRLEAIVNPNARPRVDSMFS